jgi:hypothetical protein
MASNKGAGDAAAGNAAIRSAGNEGLDGSAIGPSRGRTPTGTNDCRSIRQSRWSHSNEDLMVTFNMAREWLRLFTLDKRVGEALTELRRMYPRATIREINRAYLVARDQFQMWVADGGAQRLEDVLTVLDLITIGAPDREIAAAVGQLGCEPDVVFPRTPRTDLH